MEGENINHDNSNEITNETQGALSDEFTNALVAAIKTGVKAGITAAYSDREKPLLIGEEAAVLTNRCARSKWYALHQEGQVPAPVSGTNPFKWCRKELLEWASYGCPNRLKWEEMRNSLDNYTGEK